MYIHLLFHDYYTSANLHRVARELQLWAHKEYIARVISSRNCACRMIPRDYRLIGFIPIFSFRETMKRVAGNARSTMRQRTHEHILRRKR